MDHVSNLKPTAEIPLLSGARLFILEALKRNASYYEIMHLFPHLIKEAKSLPLWLTPKKRTEPYLQSVHNTQSLMWEVLHAIPRGILASIVLGTIAFDANQTPNRPETYGDNTGMGIYVLGISVEGRQGAWLTGKELNTILQYLDDYLVAYTVIRRYKSNPPPHKKYLLDMAETIDNQIGAHDSSTGLRFITNDDDYEIMKAFRNSLKRRRDAAMDLDQSGKTPLRQGPQYVRCSDGVINGVKAYQINPGSSALNGANKSYGITACLISMLGLTPRGTTVLATRVWRNVQLPVAEVLIAMLSFSYVSQDGFNITEAGDKLGKASPEEEAAWEEYILGREPFLFQNLERSCEEMKKRKDFMDTLTKLDPLMDPNSDINNLPNEIQLKLDQLEIQVRSLQHEEKKIKKLLSNAADKFEDARQEFLALTDIRELLEALDEVD